VRTWRGNVLCLIQITNETWEQIKTGYAAGINLREIARKMNIPEGSVLSVKLFPICRLRIAHAACGPLKPAEYSEGLRCLGNPSGDENGSDPMNYWEIIFDNLKKAGSSLGYVSAVNPGGEQSGLLTRRGDGKSSLWRESIAFGNRAELGRDIS
jgi:hypothetical protein